MKTTRFTRLARMAPVEFFDETAGGDVRKGFPRVLRIRKALPLDEVLETTIITFGVQNILDFEILLVVFDVERGRCGRTTVGGERRRFDGIEEGNMENVVDVTHRGGQLELVGLETNPFSNLEWSEAFPIEFLGGTRSGDVCGV
jgi:hypothetical protein